MQGMTAKPQYYWTLLSAYCGAILLVQAVAPAATLQTPAHWLSAGENWPVGRSAYFRRAFRLDGPAVKARLRVVGDACRMTVYLSGERVGYIPPHGQMIDLEVGEYIRRGDNALAVEAQAVDGPSAVALWLDVTFADGKTQHIATGDDWLVARKATDDWCEPSFRPDGWQRAVSHGPVAEYPFAFDGPKVGIDALENYEQWRQAQGAGEGADPTSFAVPDGFEIELLRTAQPGEDSWVSMTFDQEGRILIGMEKQGMLRLTLDSTAGKTSITRAETVEATLHECRGLLFVGTTLFANANNDKALYRLRDASGDGRFDEVKLLRKTAGSVGHGRNDLALGPDGLIHAIHGDAVELPEAATRLTPATRDIRPEDKTLSGYLVRGDAQGKASTVVCRGLRNPFGVDFNDLGDAFTYDADAEHDMGAPWYRPTRVHLLLSGADYGWRRVTGQWPPYYPDHPDSPPPLLDIGKGSPTAVKFGAKSNLPPHYQQALFILEWAYGRIIAVHMTPSGAGYVARGETFLQGRPLNVTDLEFGPDGAMYFVTGGRQTQSALYRVHYVGPKVDPPELTAQQQARLRHAKQARSLRRDLEALHGKHGEEIVATAWPHLGSNDPWIRHAARVAIEHQPADAWRQRALGEEDPLTALTGLMALVRIGEPKDQPLALRRLLQLSLADLPPEQKRTALYIIELCRPREAGFADSELRERIIERLKSIFPDPSPEVSRRAASLLIELGAPGVTEPTLRLAEQAIRQNDRMHFLFLLRHRKQDWSPGLRDRYFDLLARMHDYQGGQGMPQFIERIHNEAIAALPEPRRKHYQALLDREMRDESDALPTEKRPVVRQWGVDDVNSLLAAAAEERDLNRGREMYAAAMCSRCHRLGARGGDIGPDLTGVARRFSRRDILRAIIEPSLVVAENYRQLVVVHSGGKIATGRVVLAGDYRSQTLRLNADPLRPTAIVEIAKNDIEESQVSPVSPMPKSLLDTLSREEILDLLAYIESGGRD